LSILIYSWQLYTKAFKSFQSSAPLETKRTLLSNRAQSYLLLGDRDAALQDTDLALSNEFTVSSSPKPITMKLHYRRAKIYLSMRHYDKARVDFMSFEKLRGSRLTSDEKKLKKDIEAGASSPDGGN